MAEKMTTISLPDISGIMDRGYKDREAMIKMYRRHAEHLKQEAEKVLNAEDSDFIVEQHTGVYLRKNVRRV